MQKKNEKDQRTPSQSSGPKAFGPGPFIPSEKPKNFKKTFWRLLKYLNPRKKMLIIVVIASLLATLFNVISPKLLGDATSSIFESFIAGSGVDFDFLGNLLLILILLYTSSSIFSWLQHYLIAGVSQMTIAELRQEVNEKLSRLPLRYLDKHAHGDVLSRAVNDIDNIQTSLQQSLTQMITSIFTIIGVIVMMLIISPIMTLVVLLMLPLSGLIVKKVVSFSQRHFVNQQNELGRVNGHVEEMFSGHQVVKAFGYEQEAIKKFDDINDRLYKAGWKAQFVSGIMMPLMSFVGNLGFVMISIVGGLFVINGNLRIGDVQAFIQYSQQFSHPMAHLAGIANLIQSAIASAERIFALLDEEEEKKEQAAEVELTKLQGHVSIRNVSFSYDKKTPILKNMSLDVKEGDTVAIVGPTGAGKTTIINLLMRFYELDRGSIHIDGINLEQFSREQVRSMIAMVLQDTWLFNGTIRDNIAYGREGVTKEEVIAAAKSAFADDFIRTLPDGYDTVLGEDASNISQGQKQLLTIARAIISNPKILILDEATSSVDTRTEKNIQKAMKKLMEGRTSFVIAHRLSTIQDADVILVMNQGEILEKGTHHELLNKNGFYAELYYSQFSKKAEVS
nr:ABC transporter ATP-binding protein [Anaerobacillus alkalidiazotrophicus]